MWRDLGPIESMTGVLMCGLTVCFLFAVVTRLVDREAQGSPDMAEVKQYSVRPAHLS
jgi:hypothetical protein